MFTIKPPSPTPPQVPGPDPTQGGAPSIPPELLAALAGGAPPASPDAGADSNAQPTMADQQDASDSNKTTQQISGYMGPDMGPFECEHCLHWEDPNACNLVAGTIDPHGCCNLYQTGSTDESDQGTDQEPDQSDVNEPAEGESNDGSDQSAPPAVPGQ